MSIGSKRMLFALGVLAAGAHPAAAQETADRPPPNNVVVLGGALPAVGAVSFAAAAGRVVSEPVKGKPYSAEAVTENVQVLADGNRIVNTHRARIYRDSEGRTRREQTLPAGDSAGGESITLVTIDDVVAGTSYFLDPRTRTAREVTPFRFDVRVAEAPAPGPAGGLRSQTIIARRLPAPAEAADSPPADAGDANPPTFQIAVPPVAFGVFASTDAAPATREEDLGEQVLEGVTARGTRVTQTIPAGAIGNERPIEIVSESWYSEELGALVSSRTFDPRVGETSYRLVNVVRGEPAPQLFMVPDDYERVSDPMPPLPALPALRAPAGAAVPGARLERRFLVSPGEPAPRDE